MTDGKRREAIERQRIRNVQQFESELTESGSYEVWYAELEEFRESLSKYYKYSVGGRAEEVKNSMVLYASEVSVCGYDEISEEDTEVFRRFLKEFALYGFGERLYRLKANFRVATGDIIDHHIIGYLAPLDFKRVGWGGRYATPSEQIIRFAEYFTKRGKRFIYVALPCKGAVYPEIISDPALIRGKSNNIPQWRKMLKEIVDAGVEVLDILPLFQRDKQTERLYLKNDHTISPVGAKLVGEFIGQYLKESVDCEEKIKLSQEKSVYYEKMSEDRLWEDKYYTWRTFFQQEQGVKYPYLGSGQGSKVAFIGNCNLAAYWTEGGGILANTAYSCGLPVQYVGRFLPFDGVDNPVTERCLESCLMHDVVIYVGFPSGAFVRTSNLQFSRLSKGQWFREWSNIPLKER